MRCVRADRPVSRTLALANIRPAFSSRGLPDVSVVEQMTASNLSKPFFARHFPRLRPAVHLPRTHVQL